MNFLTNIFKKKKILKSKYQILMNTIIYDDNLCDFQS